MGNPEKVQGAVEPDTKQTQIPPSGRVLEEPKRRVKFPKVITRRGQKATLYGRTALFVGDGQEWIHQNHIIRVRLHREILLPEFVSRFLNSEQGKAQMIEKAMTTTGLHTLSTGKVASLEVPAPPLSDQCHLATHLQSQISAVERARQSLAAQLEAIERLPAALLRRAFNGEL